jgi:hypothetical protein
MAFKQPWNSSRSSSSFSSSSPYDLYNWKWKECTVTYLPRNQRNLCQSAKLPQNEGVWHLVDPKESTIMSAYDPNRPNFIPENAVWNRPKPNVEVELRDYENEVMADFKSKRQVNLERVENTINPWIKHPGLTNVYRDLLAGGPAVQFTILQLYSDRH